MKLTRRELVKKGVAASMLIAASSVLKLVIDNCYYDINDQLFPIMDKTLIPKPDLIVLNSSSVTCWDLFTFHFNVKTEEGPFMKTIEINIQQPECNIDLMDSIRDYCTRNKIFIFSESITCDIDFNNFCEYCKQISDSRKINNEEHSVYIKSIAGIYALCVDYQIANNVRTDLSLCYGNA